MNEAEQVYEMFVFSSTTMKVIAQQRFNAYICHDTFKCCVYFNIILPSRPMSPMWSLPFRTITFICN